MRTWQSFGLHFIQTLLTRHKGGWPNGLLPIWNAEAVTFLYSRHSLYIPLFYLFFRLFWIHSSVILDFSGDNSADPGADVVGYPEVSHLNLVKLPSDSPFIHHWRVCTLAFIFWIIDPCRTPTPPILDFLKSWLRRMKCIWSLVSWSGWQFWPTQLLSHSLIWLFTHLHCL